MLRDSSLASHSTASAMSSGAASVMNATLAASRPVICAPLGRLCVLPPPLLVVCVHNPHTRRGSGLPTLRSLHQPAADDQALDFAGTFIQPQQANVAIDAFHGHALHVSVAAVDLNGEIGDLAGHLGAEELRSRRS